jgi:predicted permease
MEKCRDVRAWQGLEIFWSDVCYGSRRLMASRVFTVTAILSLALGIGANTAMFTLMRVALWKPLPVQSPGELFQMVRSDPSPDAVGEIEAFFSWPIFREMGDAFRPFGEVAAKTPAGERHFGMTMDSAERVTGEAVSANFFHTLRVAPEQGRLLMPEDENSAGGNRVAVLSDSFWKRRFQRDPSIIGQAIFYNENLYTVVGVAQPGFGGVQAGTQTDVWVPIVGQFTAADLQAKWDADFQLFARVNPGVKVEQAQAAANGRFQAYVMRELVPRFSRTDPKYAGELKALSLSLQPARSGLAGVGQHYERPLFVLMGVVVLVLLICCANVGNLVLERTMGRQHEIALRRALGASRMRILAQLMTENLLVVMAGAAVGVGLAMWAVRGMIAMLPSARPALVFDPNPDAAVLGFTAVVAIGTALLLSLLPTMQATQTEASLMSKSSVRSAGRSLMGRALIVTQLALSLVLLVGAGLFLGTIRNLKATNLGFHPESITSFDVSFARTVTPDRVARGYDQIRKNLESAPGVMTVSYAWPSVYSKFRWSRGIKVDGTSPGWSKSFACGVSVGPDFFETLGMGLKAGRFLNEQDQTGAALNTVVNQSFVQANFGSISPVGRQVVIDGFPTARTWTIVGVVPDAKHYGVREKVCPTTYVPAAHASSWNAFGGQGIGSFLVRSDAQLAPQEGFIRAAVGAVGGGAQIEQMQPLETIVNDMVTQERIMASLCTVFSLIAIVLAAIGLYGVVAYGVSQRTAELGIRIALGAQRWSVVRLVLHETAQLVLLGTVIGVVAAFGLTRLVASMLYGVRPDDMGFFAGATALLAMVAAGAGYLPARRAARIDPMIAIRHE